MQGNDIELKEVLKFWFEELSEKDWFAGGEELDSKITERFKVTHKRVSMGEYWRYRSSAYSYLAEVIVLDQFSRQIFRDSAQAFSFDGQALTLAQEAILKGYDNELSKNERLFLYMPFMHSESKVIHEEALRFFESLGEDSSLTYEKIHKDIIDRFGRYPHRNLVLGRDSTPDEMKYLKENQEDFF